MDNKELSLLIVDKILKELSPVYQPTTRLMIDVLAGAILPILDEHRKENE